MNEQQLLRYSRHIFLNEIDVEGQEKISQATVLIIGCGGLGNACTPLLAGAGVAHLILCDDDSIESSNLPRQLCFQQQDIQQSKAEVLAHYLQQRNPDLTVTVLKQRADADLLHRYVPQADIIADCSDNSATRYLINQIAYQYQKPLVSASVIQFSGQLTVFHSALEHSPCYACLFPTPKTDETSCFKNGVFSPLVHIIGAAQAGEILKLIIGMGQSSVGQMLQFEGLNFATYAFKLNKNPHCPICGVGHQT